MKLVPVKGPSQLFGIPTRKTGGIRYWTRYMISNMYDVGFADISGICVEPIEYSYRLPSC